MGGNSVAPMLTAATTEPIIGFSPFALVVAMATATAVMFLTNELSRRFDI
jgi:CBS-domain-containing membrane protein